MTTQEHASVSYFQANSNQGALNTLNDFVAGKDTDLKISGCESCPSKHSRAQLTLRSFSPIVNGSTATDSLSRLRARSGA